MARGPEKRQGGGGEGRLGSLSPQRVGESEIPELPGEAEEEPASQLPLAVLWGLYLPPPCASCPPSLLEALG